MYNMNLKDLYYLFYESKVHLKNKNPLIQKFNLKIFKYP